MGKPSMIIGILGLVLLMTAKGWPHAELVKSSPASGAVLSQAPGRIYLWFNERLKPFFATVSVWDAQGTQVDTRDVRIAMNDLRQLSVGLPSLAPGTYTVKYWVQSPDGHIAEGQFSFTLQKPP